MYQPRAQRFLQKAAEAGRLGDSEIVEIVFDKTKGEDQFASQVVFATVKLKKENVYVVIKMQSENELVCEQMNTGTQFYNEAVMYEHILPFLEQNNIVNELLPDFIHAHVTTDQQYSEDFIIIQSLGRFGFRLTEEKLFLDYDHAVLAFRNLGRFHALSYAAKQRDYKKFMEEVNRLKEVQYLDKKRHGINVFWGKSAERGITSSSEKTEYKTVLEKHTNVLTKDPYTFMKSLVAPEEPIAVICHGDFCRNNILYKYEDNKPVNVKFFDLATSRYSSPAIDLSFFLLLNVPSQVRKERWDDLLAAYHDGLSNGVPGTKVPSLDDIKLEMRKKSLYGYVHCSFFLPVMIEDERQELADWLSLDDEVKQDMMKNYGGQKATKAIADILEDLILKKCL